MSAKHHAPESAAACLDLVRELKGQGKRLRIRGAGTRDSPWQGLTISSTHWQQVRFFQPEDMVIGVEAGMPVSSLHELLDEHGMELPVNAWFDKATVGGVVAANDFGPDRMFAGGIRDFLIGIEYINGDGLKVKAGGRVVKNVTGYDASRMMIGSRGGLGCITAVNFRLVPKKPNPMIAYQNLQLSGTGKTFAKAEKQEIDRLLAQVKLLIREQVPLDWVQLRGKSGHWHIAFGYSGNDSRLQRLHQLFRQHLDQGWSFCKEADGLAFVPWNHKKQRYTGFLSSMKDGFTNPAWHFHVVAPTANWRFENIYSAIQENAHVVLHPFGGDAHFFFDAATTSWQTLREIFGEISQWGAVECVTGPGELIAEKGRFFPRHSAQPLMVRLKNHLDPEGFFHSDFFEETP